VPPRFTATAPSRTIDAIAVCAACWTAAFGLYAAVHAPRLLKARVDGRVG